MYVHYLFLIAFFRKYGNGRPRGREASRVLSEALLYSSSTAASDVSESAPFPFGVFPHFGRLVGGGGGVSVLFIYEVKTIRPPRRKITVDLQLDDPSCKMVL